MVFTPTGGGFPEPPSADEVLDAKLAAKAVRSRRGLRPGTGNGRRRLAWRAIIRARGREAVVTEWHLAACSNPALADAHCPEGRRLIQTVGEPEGHCLVDGQCPLCEGSA